MGAVLGASDGLPPLHVDGGGQLQPHRLRAAGRVRAGQVVHPAGRASTRHGPDHRDRAACRRATTPSGCCAPPARASRSGPRTVSVRPAERAASSARSTCRATSRRPRRSSSPRRCCAESPPVRARHVDVNPTRTGLLTVLERMGARINLFNRRTTGGGEPIADVEVRPAELVATEIEPRDRADA